MPQNPQSEKKLSSLKASLFNPRLFKNKFLQFKALVAVKNYDVMRVRESQIHSHSNNFVSEYIIKEYKIFYRSSSDGEFNGVFDGEVVLYILENLHPI